MSITLSMPEITELKPRITVMGVGGAGCNAVNNMIKSKLEGVDFVVANTDAQSLAFSSAERHVQLGIKLTKGLGAGSKPEIGRAATEEAIDHITEQLTGSHMVFITAGMGGGTGTGGAPVVAQAARDMGVLTVGVVTKPFQFEGTMRARIAERGIEELQQHVDTLIIIPNQNLFRIATEKTTFADACAMADDVLYSGVRGITDLMVMPGLINLDFADVKSVINEMGKAMMGTGEAEGEKRALEAAESAILNPLLDDVSLKGARGVLINITGGADMMLFEVDEAATRIRSEVDPEANIIIGSTFDDTLDGKMRVSVFATGIGDGEVALGPERTAADVRSWDSEIRIADPSRQSGEPLPELETPIVSGDESRAEHGESPDPEVTADADAPTADGSDQPDERVPPEPLVAEPLPDAHFIAPEPMRPDDDPNGLATADPFAEAAITNGGVTDISGKRERGPSLLQRVTGSKRLRRPSKPAASAEKAESAVESSPLLGRMNPEDRISQQLDLEDQLQIPAFLRRQAN